MYHYLATLQVTREIVPPQGSIYWKILPPRGGGEIWSQGQGGEKIWKQRERQKKRKKRRRQNSNFPQDNRLGKIYNIFFTPTGAKEEKYPIFPPSKNSWRERIMSKLRGKKYLYFTQFFHIFSLTDIKR